MHSANQFPLKMEVLGMKHVFTRFCVMQGAYWSFHAALLGYYTAYVLEKGMSASLWGVILSANLLCSFVGSLVWCRWVDRHQASKRFFLLGNAAAMVLGCLLFFFADVPALVMTLFPLLGFLVGPIPTVLDAWVITSFPERRDAGGRSRSFATLSYAFVMLIAGQLVSRIGYGIMPVTTILFLGISITAALFQPESSAAMARVRRESAPSAGMKGLLASRRYVLLVIALFFTGMAIAPINSMKVLVLKSVGGDVAMLGWDSFIGCMIQAQFLIFSRYLLRVKAEKRLLAGLLAPLFYALLVAVARAPFTVILGTIMNNISFGILYPTMREITEDSVTPALRNTAHSLIDVAYGSFAGMIATSWSGALLDGAGVAALGTVCAGIQVIAVGCCFLLLANGRKRAHVRAAVTHS